MAIQWSPLSGRMRVGIDFRHSAVGPSTTQVTLYVDFYIRVENWRYDDMQSLGMAVTDRFLFGIDFHNYQASHGTYQWLAYTATFPNEPIRYGGGPTISAYCNITGAYDGSAPSLSRSFTFPARPASVPNAPGLTIQSVTNSSAYTKLTAPSNNGSSIVEYQIQVATDTGFTNVVATRSSSGTVSGLSAATTYRARARARNGVGWGPWSSTRTFTTGATVPSKVGTVTPSNIGQLSADLAWSAPANGGSAIEEYEVQIATNSGFSSGVQNFIVDSSPYTLTDLLPGTQYWARVRAINGVGEGPYSDAATLTTLAGTPVIVSPTEGQAKTNGRFEATIESLGITGSADFEVEFSKDNTFTTGVTLVESSVTGPTPNNRYSVVGPNLQGNGTWYIRARVTNNVSAYTTPWSATRTYTQAHTPSRTPVSPIANSVVGYGATNQFRWNFVDSASPLDVQSAYHLVIEDNATGETIHDSGKTTLASLPGNNQVTVDVALDAGVKNDVLRWRVKVWDSLDQESGWSGWNLFRVSDPPVVTIIEPTAGVDVDSGAPTFAWISNIQSGGSQARADIEVFDADTNALVWSATVLGTATSVTPETVVFLNDSDYYYSLVVRDTNGLQTIESETFHTSYVAPEEVDYQIIANEVDSLGYIDVDWLSGTPDQAFVSWRVYRRRISEDSWTLVTEIFDQNVRNYRDFYVKDGETYVYSVTQTAMRSGVKLESPVGYRLDEGNPVPENRAFPITLSYYWLIHPTDVNLSVRLVNVVSDSTTLEFEREVYNLIGRGRHVDYGDELGYAGTITCQVRTGESQSSFRKTMEDLRRSQTEYFLRTPFGRLFKVSLGNIEWNPMAGTGHMENGELSFSYEQVS